MPVAKKQRTSKSRSTTVSQASNDLPSSSGYLLTCDAPTKQFIKLLDESKNTDKKFILEDLDPSHLLIKVIM